MAKRHHDQEERESIRRTRSPKIDIESAKCPLCHRDLIAVMKRTGPGWVCGCPERGDVKRARPVKMVRDRRGTVARQLHTTMNASTV